MNMGNKKLERPDFGMGSGAKIENEDIISLREKILNKMSDSSLKEISDIIMEEARRLTSSESCYVAFVDPENRDSVGISFSHMTDGCQMYEDMGEARFKIRKDGTYGGLLGYSLDTGESFYIHNPALHPAAHGLPEGHAPVSQFLSAPVKYNDNIIGQIVLGNPEKDYTSFDVDLADTIADIYAVALKKLLY
ncbi:MAG: GAF domain-containing protein [Methanobacterium sp.]|nr:GAF domain-containing protein [Methanobacterium sp.]